MSSGSMRRKVNQVATAVPKPRTWGGIWDIFGSKLVDLLDIPSGAKVLDVGTGGGSTLFPAAAKVGPEGSVVGIDLSQDCIDSTSAEIERCGIKNASVMLMDGRSTSFTDGDFDYVVAGFIGWSDWFDFDKCEYKGPDRLMNELVRVLRRGGKAGISSWISLGDSDWMKRLAQDYVLNTKEVYSKENREGWQIIMNSSGFRDIVLISETADCIYASKEDLWNKMLDSGWREQIDFSREKGDSVLREFKRSAMKSLMEKNPRDGEIRFETAALFAVGTR